MSDNTKVAVAEKKPALVANGGRPAAIVPSDFESAYRLGNLVVKSGMAPKSFDTPEKATVAIMHGLEVGLTPMAALQSIAVVNGMPTIWGDGLLALIQGSGLLEDIEETSEVNDKGEWQWSVCKMKRRDRPTPTVRQFTRAMASRAGLLNKQGPWSQYPDRMGQMRARSWCGRDTFPDVLRGLHNTEETMDMVDMTDVGSVTTTAPEPRRGDFKPAPTQQQAADPAPAEQEQRVKEPTWLMYDYTGEEGDEFFAAVAWLDRFTQILKQADDPAIRAGYLRANEDTAVDILTHGSLTDEQKEGLRGFYDPPAEERQQARDWTIPDNIVGQDKKLAALWDLLTKTQAPADVEDLAVANEAFLAKLTGLKKAEAEKRLMDRKISLGQQQAAE